MKIIKKIIIALLNILLIDLIIILVLNCTIKKLLVDELLIESFKQNNPLISENVSNNSPFIINNKVLEKTLEDEEVKEMLSEFIDDVISNISKEEQENINIEELEKKVIEYTKEHKKELEEKTGVEITDEMINEASKLLNDGDVKKSFEQEINNYKNNITKEEKIALKFYNFITSKDLRTIIIILIIVNILLIAILQKSIYKWIKNLSRAMYISGLSIVILGLAIKYLISTLTLLVINPKEIFIIGISLIVFGLLINIVYRIMEKYYIKENKYDIS